MEWFTLIVILALAAFFAVSGVRLLKDGTPGGEMTTTLPYFGETKIRGAAIGGALCIIAALAAMMLAVEFVLTSGSSQEPQRIYDSPEANSRRLPTLTVPLFAQIGEQEHDEQEQAARDETPVDSDSIRQGWVYLGPQDIVADWTFHRRGDADYRGGAPLTGQVACARNSMLIREDHYTALTGTLIGAILRAKEPRVVGTVQAGTCVQVVDQESVGFFDDLWIEIQPIDAESAVETDF